MRLFILLILFHLPAQAAPLLKVLTYNVNGIPVATPYWPQKRDAIAAKLRESPYDVVALQEAWNDADAKDLADASGFPYRARNEHGGSIGTGLMILSRYPIMDQREFVFTCRPSALRWMTGEPVANKGALMVRVKTPRGPLDVYTAHPVAAYTDARYETLRWTQIFELAEFAVAHSQGRPFLLLGDLNFSPGEAEYRLLSDLLGLDDACLEKGKDVCGVTNEEDHARIDHVLVPRGAVRIASARTAFSGHLPGTDIPYSDHLAVEAEVDARILNRKLAPEPKARAAALAAVAKRLAKMTDAMNRREENRSWLPIYGFLIVTRYDRQRVQLAAISARAESSRIRLLQGRP